VRSENQFTRIQFQLLENFSDMAMSEDRVGGQVVRHRNEVGARSRFLARAEAPDFESEMIPFSRSTMSAASSGANAESPKWHSSRDWPPAPHRVAGRVQLRKAVHCFFHEVGRSERILVVKAIDGAVFCASRKRHAPLRSTTRMPWAIASGTSARDTSCGVAKTVVRSRDVSAQTTTRAGNGYPPLPEMAGYMSARIDFDGSFAGTLKHHRNF